jgi:hypothetical protein
VEAIAPETSLGRLQDRGAPLLAAFGGWGVQDGASSKTRAITLNSLVQNVTAMH